MCSVHLLPSSLELVILKLFGLRTSSHFLPLLRISKELLLTWIISNDIYYAVLCLVSWWYPTLWDPMVCSLPGSSVHGILQARILEWVAMPSSRGSSQPRGSNPGLPHCRWILYFLSHQGSPEYWRGWPIPSPGNLPDPGIELGSPELQVDSLSAELPGKPWYLSYYLLNWEIFILFQIKTTKCTYFWLYFCTGSKKSSRFQMTIYIYIYKKRL